MYCKHCKDNHPATEEFWTWTNGSNQCKEYCRKKSREWRQKNRDKHRKYQRKYNKEHRIPNPRVLLTPEQRRANKRAYLKNRLETDMNFRITYRLRKRIWKAFSRKNIDIPLKYLGCTARELRTHLESKFKPGMTWDNYGRKGWVIDHIIPLSWFDLRDWRSAAIALNYTNLQPLWYAENQLKSNKRAG